MAKQTIKMVIQLRRGTTAEWLANKDVVPAAGEPCFDVELNTLKIGDGTTTYENLEPIGGTDGVEFTADGKSVILEEGVLKLFGLDTAAVGAQPRKAANGSIEWIVPSTETVDGLKATVAGLQSDVTSLQEIVTPSGEGAVSLLDRVEGLEEKVGEDNIDAKIDKKINEFAAKVSDDGTVNTLKELVDYVAEHGSEVSTMAADITSLKGLVGGKAVSTQILEAIEASGHVSEKEAKAIFEKVKYEITDTPVGTLVDYREKEIRVMCPAGTEWKHQTVGTGGDSNTYYMTFKTYVPNDNIVGYIEHLGDQVDKEILTTFSTDEYGRRYQVTWLGLAKYDETTGAWTYYGKNSSASKYIGWDYQIDWYNADGIVVATDSVRINLSNEACHSAIEPYFMAGVVKGATIGGSLLNVVEGKVEIPVGAGLKSSEEVVVNEDGTLAIGQISFSKIMQVEDEEVVLDGGSAGN